MLYFVILPYIYCFYPPYISYPKPQSPTAGPTPHLLLTGMAKPPPAAPPAAWASQVSAHQGACLWRPHGWLPLLCCRLPPRLAQGRSGPRGGGGGCEQLGGGTGPDPVHGLAAAGGRCGCGPACFSGCRVQFLGSQFFPAAGFWGFQSFGFLGFKSRLIMSTPWGFILPFLVAQSW